MLQLIDEAQRAGARLDAACETLGLSSRTVRRWRKQGGGEDRRRGPRTRPSNRLSEAEKQRILVVLNSPRFRDLPPSQVVPLLADEDDVYLASESTMYRILREKRQLAHREASRPRLHRRPRERVAIGPNQVWSWDITYLRSPIRGQFYYLYMFVDVWSRKIVGAEVHEEESNEIAARMFREICEDQDVDPENLVLHSDNGGPMKGSTMQATLESLGVIPSLSRPRVSNDNPFSESLFRTLKYRPGYPEGPFESLGYARLWVRSFVGWYNEEHLHSGIGFVTPSDRHEGRDQEILENRRRVYQEACKRHPERFASGIRKWKRPDVVRLNPERKDIRHRKESQKFSAAA